MPKPRLNIDYSDTLKKGDSIESLPEDLQARLIKCGIASGTAPKLPRGREVPETRKTLGGSQVPADEGEDEEEAEEDEETED